MQIAAKSKWQDIFDILKFTFPIILTNVFQNMFTIIDHLVVSSHGGDTVLASIGATANLASLFTQFVIGISIGASAVIAQRIGSKNKEAVHKSVHTAVTLGLIGGTMIALLGAVFSRPVLVLMKTPASILDDATAYMIVLCISFLPQTLYNFGSAALRAMGDSKRPLYFLAISGIVKTGLTYVFVAVFDKSVVYVALTTVVSFMISSVLTLIALVKKKDEYHLSIRQLRWYRREVKDILFVGFPIGLMNSFMSLSNVVMQSAVNSFGELAIAGNTAANHINTLLYSILNAFSHTSTIACSKHYGGVDPKGFKRSLIICIGLMTVCGLLAGSILFVLRKEILGLFVESKEGIRYGLEWVNLICFTYVINGAQEIFRGALTALNQSVYPMLSQTIGFFVFRIVWVNTYFVSHRSMSVLYYSYPLSWMITLGLNIIFFVVFFRRQYGNRRKVVDKRKN